MRAERNLMDKSVPEEGQQPVSLNGWLMILNKLEYFGRCLKFERLIHNSTMKIRSAVRKLKQPLTDEERIAFL